MGADQIGYLVKGPKELDASKRQQAIEHGITVATKARQYLAMGEVEGQDIQREAFIAEHLPHLLHDEFPTIEHVAGFKDNDVVRLVEDMLKCWNGEARDVASRTDPDDPTQILVYAGGMSWGDEPDGYGYETFRDSAYLNLWPVFGIR